MATSPRPVPLALLGLLCLAPSLAAQAPRAMKIADVISLPAVTDPQLSPDGRQLVFARSDADWKADRRVSHLWRLDVASGTLAQLTNGERGESSPRWAPDGRSIAFLARRGEVEETQIWLLPADGGEARRLSKHATSVSDITWAPDGKALFFRAAEAKSAEQKERDRLKDDVYSLDEDYQQEHLWKVSMEGAETRITTGDYSVVSYDLARDGRRLAVQRAPTPLLADRDLSEVWVMDADGSNARRLTDNKVGEGNAQLSPDDSGVLFTCGCNAAFQPYYQTRIFLQPVAGGPARPVFTDLPFEIERAAWSADGRVVYFVANMGVHSELFRGDIASGKTTQLTRGDHTLGGWSLALAAGQHVVTIDDAASPGEAWTLPLDGGSPRRLTHVFDALVAQYRLPRQEKVSWKGQDGVVVEGLLYYPLDYQVGTRYPLVVQTHGGPQASDRFGFGRWINYTQVLTGMGYAVLKPNYRGSTGYGDEFLRDMVGHYYQNAHLDVMAGVDYLVGRGIADPDRLVAMGWSAGGHMTDKLITFTDRFKAAAAGAGASDWISMVAESDVRTHRFNWFGGSPWEKDAPIDNYWKSSPLSEVWKVKTPTIFLVGGSDVRVPMPQSVEMFRALRHNGVPTHLYVAPREPHGWAELRHQLYKVNTELGWFEKYARGRSYTWEQAPGSELPAAKAAP